MSVTIIECAIDSITLTSFIKKDTALVVEYTARKLLENIQKAVAPQNWINQVSQAIHELITEAKSLFPVTILLPGFVLLTKVLQVPRVAPSRQSEIIKTHIHNVLSTGKEEYLAYDIIDSGEFELTVVCVLVKKNWIESFCREMELIDMEITSIEPPAIHYYNAYRWEFPKEDRPRLLLVMQHLSVCYLFINRHLESIHQIPIKDTFLAEEIKRLIDLYNKKNPQSGLQEIAISGKLDNEKIVSALERCIGLPVKAFTPINSELSHSIGSIGAAHRHLFVEGLSIDLTPSKVKNTWAFNRSKKAILIAGVCVIGALLIVFSNIIERRMYYEERRKALEAKIFPLREWASIIDRNEKSISLHNQGLSALDSCIKSNKSWVHFLNSLQSSLATIPGARIHSLKVVELENKPQNTWTHELMGVQEPEILLNNVRLMQITGSFVAQVKEPTNNAIDTLGVLMSELAKLESVAEAKNFHFDIQNLPTVSFSISLVLKPNSGF